MSTFQGDESCPKKCLFLSIDYKGNLAKDNLDRKDITLGQINFIPEAMKGAKQE